MRSLQWNWILTGPAFLISLLAAGAASAQATSTQPKAQVVDHVAAFGKSATSATLTLPSGTVVTVPSAVFELTTKSPRPRDYDPLLATPTTSAGFGACQLTAQGGLVCLDDKLVRQWDAPGQYPEKYTNLFSCTNGVFGFDKKSDTCTSLTVDLAGAYWLAGKKSNTYSMVKVTRPPCDTAHGEVAFSDVGGAFCSREYASGRPYFNDVNDEEGDAISGNATLTGFRLGTGISGVQTRDTLVVFGTQSWPATVTAIASGKQLGLSGSESVQSAALMRVPTSVSTNAAGPFYMVYATSTGKIRVVNTNDTTTRVSDVVLDVADTSANGVRSGLTACSTVDKFGVRTSSTTGNIYVSDKRYCRVYALTPQSDAGRVYGFKLAVLQDSASQPLKLSTGTLSPDSPTVAPGTLVDFADFGANCTDCTLVPTQTTNPGTGVKLQGVTVQNVDQRFMTLFLIRHIPDCRYPRDDNQCAGHATAVRDCAPTQATCQGATGIAAKQYLNITELLPNEVLTAFPNLPPMWMSPQYIGQPVDRSVPGRNREFDALLGIPQFDAATGKYVEFKNTFRMDFDMPQLTGKADRCTPAPTSTAPAAWDVVTTVSERFPTFSNGALDNLDATVNSDCGGSGTSGGRWSIYTYNVEPNPDTVQSVYSGSTLVAEYLSRNDDAVNAKLVDGLFNDLGRTEDYICGTTVTTGGPAAFFPDLAGQSPISASTCSTLTAGWANARDKLTKCIGASTQPKQSSGAQNCTAFQSQIGNYISTLSAIPAALPGKDVANRIGELKARAFVVQFLFINRLLPTIPDAGFCEQTTCPGVSQIFP